MKEMKIDYCIPYTDLHAGHIVLDRQSLEISQTSKWSLIAAGILAYPLLLVITLLFELGLFLAMTNRSWKIGSIKEEKRQIKEITEQEVESRKQLHRALLEKKLDQLTDVMFSIFSLKEGKSDKAQVDAIDKKLKKSIEVYGASKEKTKFNPSKAFLKAKQRIEVVNQIDSLRIEEAMLNDINEKEKFQEYRKSYCLANIKQLKLEKAVLRHLAKKVAIFMIPFFGVAMFLRDTSTIDLYLEVGYSKFLKFHKADQMGLPRSLSFGLFSSVVT